MDDVDVVFAEAIPRLQERLRTGEIDAFALWEPHVSRAEAALERRSVVFDAPDLVTNTANVVATSELVADLAGKEKIPNYLDLLYLEGLEQVAPNAATLLR